jgi:hypothetical protein
MQEGRQGENVFLGVHVIRAALKAKEE